MTTEQQTSTDVLLPITDFLEEKKDGYCFIDRIIPQVRSLEEAQQKKIQEAERSRIVGILEEMKNPYDICRFDNLNGKDCLTASVILRETISRITL